ncbi:hypothetical protein AK830_g11799 [Neonectria ditissima]|uniref:Uncharacterized protein n=1 Tax=Neonectria ditissima TaxID=78410 RepID=A0A0P7B4H6_9HYPO|nr:hypothetical protein AK830_g11799 [Neonectria ditissima]
MPRRNESNRRDNRAHPYEQNQGQRNQPSSQYGPNNTPADCNRGGSQGGRGRGSGYGGNRRDSFRPNNEAAAAPTPTRVTQLTTTMVGRTIVDANNLVRSVAFTNGGQIGVPQTGIMAASPLVPGAMIAVGQPEDIKAAADLVYAPVEECTALIMPRDRHLHAQLREDKSMRVVPFALSTVDPSQQQRSEAQLLSSERSNMKHKVEEDAREIALLKQTIQSNTERAARTEHYVREAGTLRQDLRAMQREKNEALAELQAMRTAARPTPGHPQTSQPSPASLDWIARTFQDIPHTIGRRRGHVHVLAKHFLAGLSVNMMKYFLQVANLGEWYCVVDVCRKGGYPKPLKEEFCSRHIGCPRVRVVMSAERVLEFEY